MKTGNKIINRLVSESNLDFEYTRTLRRDFHRHPELGFQEQRTSQIIAEALKSFGLKVQSGVAQTGVVALIEGARPSPVLMLRFDMDALPIHEQTGAEYASHNPGVMHACGHDGHVAIGLTVARILAGLRSELPGTVKLVFQPAEEGLGGAARMISEGVLEHPRPDFALGLHLWNEKPLGWLGVTPGPAMTAGDIFKIALTGSGGHGAQPHLTVDPVVAAAQLVIGLQSIVSRNVPPLQTAVISVTTIHGGEAFNIIPAQVQLMGTIRTFEPQVRQLVHQRFQEIVAGTAQINNCQVETELVGLTPSLVNNPEIASRVAQTAAEILPEFQVDTGFRSMASEDMAFFLEQIPGCFFFVGSANPERGLDAPHHNPRFDFDENVLSAAVSLLCVSSFTLLARKYGCSCS